MRVVYALALQQHGFVRLDPGQVDILLVDLDEGAEHRIGNLFDILERWKLPVLFNDGASQTQSSDERELGRRLALKLVSMMPHGTGWQ